MDRGKSLTGAAAGCIAVVALLAWGISCSDSKAPVGTGTSESKAQVSRERESGGTPRPPTDISSSGNPQRGTETPSARVPALTITTDALLEEYRSTERGRYYTGKVIDLEGIVQGYEEDMMRRPGLRMKSASRFLRTVVAKFDESNEAMLRTVPSGGLVTVRCRCGGPSARGNVILNECEIVRPPVDPRKFH